MEKNQQITELNNILLILSKQLKKLAIYTAFLAADYEMEARSIKRTLERVDLNIKD